MVKIITRAVFLPPFFFAFPLNFFRNH